MFAAVLGQLLCSDSADIERAEVVAPSFAVFAISACARLRAD